MDVTAMWCFNKLRKVQALWHFTENSFPLHSNSSKFSLIINLNDFWVSHVNYPRLVFFRHLFLLITINFRSCLCAALGRQSRHKIEKSITCSQLLFSHFTKNNKLRNAAINASACNKNSRNNETLHADT